MNTTRIEKSLHYPVLIKSLISNIWPVKGIWIDCTFGAGGYTKALLEAGADKVISIDRDPDALSVSQTLKDKYCDKIDFFQENFSNLEEIIENYSPIVISGIVLDAGMSSMQIDNAKRGFSFSKSGPLDMRMSQVGVTAYDLVNQLSESELSNIIFYYGEERAAKAIAKAIVHERKLKTISSTDHLAHIVNRVKKPFSKYSTVNPATKTFQAIRIAVNDELNELIKFLLAAERVLVSGAYLAIVTFHSLEDRVVKNFFKCRSGSKKSVSRYFPQINIDPVTFRELNKKVIKPSDNELRENSRARSAKLRIGIRAGSEFIVGKQKAFESGIPEVRFQLGKN